MYPNEEKTGSEGLLVSVCTVKETTRRRLRIPCAWTLTNAEQAEYPQILNRPGTDVFKPQGFVLKPALERGSWCISRHMET